jgi:hypothetical protein
MDYRKYYHIEKYLFKDVYSSFHHNGYLTASDFFFIIIWKSNRSKSKEAKRILHISQLSLPRTIKKITETISQKPTQKEKMSVLINDWKFKLSTASAILTVLYPNQFTIYDRRVLNLLKLPNINNIGKFDKLWKGYCEYKKLVVRKTPRRFKLRDKDRYLWGKSIYRQLKADIKSEFLAG